MLDHMQPCPCGFDAAFRDCCEQIINGTRESQSATELLRARYSAFATGAIDFIISTTHTRTRREVDPASIREWSETSIWHGLHLLDSKDVDEDTTYISFEAHFSQNGKDVHHRETSLFERDHGKWMFVTGTEMKNPTVRYETARPGRNDPCPCQSGRKYKKCCGQTQS